MVKKAIVDIKKLVLSDKELETSINVKTNTLRWKISGFADPRNKVDIQIFNRDHQSTVF
jgi:hypothetical protein